MILILEKIFDSHIEEIIVSLFGKNIDEYGELYSNVYKYEIEGIKDCFINDIINWFDYAEDKYVPNSYIRHLLFIEFLVIICHKVDIEKLEEVANSITNEIMKIK